METERLVLEPFPRNVDELKRNYLDWYQRGLMRDYVTSGTGAKYDSPEALEKDLERWAREQGNQLYIWTLDLKGEPYRIGDVFIRFNVDPRIKSYAPEEKVVETGIQIIEPAYLNQGFAKETMRSILHYSFEDLGIDSIIVAIYTDNEPSLKLHRSLGFEEVAEIIEEESGREEYLLVLRKHKWRKIDN